MSSLIHYEVFIHPFTDSSIHPFTQPNQCTGLISDKLNRTLEESGKNRIFLMLSRWSNTQSGLTSIGLNFKCLQFTVSWHSTSQQDVFIIYNVKIRRASLVAQCRRHEFNPWSGKIPNAMEQLSLCTTTIEAALPSLGAATTEPTCHNQWSPHA